MVMKKDGRKRDIKSKLVAAVCMLLVSCIMMVSSTYAWFTLSTAPEVKGISTSVGSNGNLEIALSPESGDGSQVGDLQIGSTDGWVVKNLTWGNLLDLSDESYGLQNWTLSPSQLLLSGDATNGYKFVGAPLAIPEYGSDGRVTALNKTDVSFGGDGKYGVRPVGSASGLTLRQNILKNNLQAILTNADLATGAASKSLSANGQALASIMVQHAKAGGSDTNDYKAFVPDLVLLTNDLDASVDYLKEAIRAAVIVSMVPDTTTYTTDEAFELAVNQILAMPIDDFWTQYASQSSYAGDITAVVNAVSAAQSAAAALPTDGTKVDWTAVSAVVTKLMNTTGVKISGFTIDEIKAEMENMDFLLGLATNCRIELGEGSGVYYDIAAVAGNITASTTATVDAGGSFGSVTLKNVIITTTYTGTPKLDTAHAALKAGTQAPDTGAGSSVIDTFYGYVIDFMFRTNAADSKLLLQTDGAQRVYDDSANEATQGAGSTFTFTTTDAKQVATLKGMVQALRVVFFTPGDSSVLGVAKATTVTTTEETVGTTTTYTITGHLVLCSYTVADGLVTVGNELSVDDTTTKNFDESDILTTLSQNVATAVSAMVYLDGANLSNADMLTSGEVAGKLNLQFASSAELVPMENNDLFQGGGETPATTTPVAPTTSTPANP